MDSNIYLSPPMDFPSIIGDVSSLLEGMEDRITLKGTFYTFHVRREEGQAIHVGSKSLAKSRSTLELHELSGDLDRAIKQASCIDSYKVVDLYPFYLCFGSENSFCYLHTFEDGAFRQSFFLNIQDFDNYVVFDRHIRLGFDSAESLCSFIVITLQKYDQYMSKHTRS